MVEEGGLIMVEVDIELSTMVEDEPDILPLFIEDMESPIMDEVDIELSIIVEDELDILPPFIEDMESPIMDEVDIESPIIMLDESEPPLLFPEPEPEDGMSV